MTEVLQFPFARGIDEGTDPKALTPGTPLVLTNRYIDKTGRSRKRWGVTSKTASILGGGSIAAGARLITRGDDLAMFDGTTLYAYGSAVSAWQAIDRPCPLVATKQYLADATRSVLYVDVAITGDLIITVYVVASTNFLFYDVRSLSTGATLVPETLLVGAATAAPRVVVNTAGTIAHIVYPYAGKVAAIKLTLSTLTAAASADLVTDATTSPKAIDAVIGAPSGVDTLYLAYEKQAGTFRATLASFNISTYAAIGTLAIVGNNIAPPCISYGALANSVTVAFSSVTAGLTRLFTADVNLAAITLGPTTVFAGVANNVFVAEFSATQLLVGWVRNDVGAGSTDADRLTTALYSLSAHAQVASSERITFGLAQVTKPWKVAGRWYAAATIVMHPYSPTATDPVAQSSTVVVEIETAASITGNQDATHPHVATLENQTSWYANFVMNKPATDASGNVYVPAAVRTIEPYNYGSPLPLSWTLHKLTASAPTVAQVAKLSGSAFCAGAAPFWYDGTSAFPYGFSHAPQIISATPVAGVSMVAGTYGYIAVYVWPDANGLRHRSVPSPPKTAAPSAANLAVNVKVATASLSGRQRTFTSGQAANPVLIEVYRTIVNGPDYFRLTLEPSYNVLINDARANDVTLSDTKADSNIASGSPAVTLASRAALYSASALEDVPPPASIAVLAHNRRLWLVASDGHTVWPSKDASDDPTVAPGFNEALTLYFVRPKNALGPLDELTVVLGPDSIDFVAGLGPDAQGNGAWSQAAMQTDVGCIEPRSVVAIPQGLVFQSRRSLELLTRERTLAWFGKPVQDTLTTYPTITSAVVVANQHQVRFTCNNVGLTAGVVLVYDYVRDAWSTFDYGFPVADACMVAGIYTLLRYTGVVLQEDTTTHLDNGVYVPSAVEMPISPSGTNAWLRVKAVQIVGTSETNHDLTIRVRRDFAAAYDQSKPFLAQTDATTIGPLEQARMILRHQKGQGFSFRVEDAAPTSGALGTGAGPILEGLALAVQRKEGLPKLSASRKG